MRLKFPILLAFMVIMYHLAVVVFGGTYERVRARDYQASSSGADIVTLVFVGRSLTQRNTTSFPKSYRRCKVVKAAAATATASVMLVNGYRDKRDSQDSRSGAKRAGGGENGQIVCAFPEISASRMCDFVLIGSVCGDEIKCDEWSKPPSR